MLSLDEARSLLAAAVTPRHARAVPLERALGLRLAAAVRSDVDMPPGDVSAMDGFAVRAADLAAGGALPIAFAAAAGDLPAALPPGRAARIYTGALLPAGADTVVQQELAERLADGSVRLAALAAGSNVRRCGEVVRAGGVVAAGGALVTPQALAALAAAGATRPRVVPRPRVALLVTGAELVDAATTPGPGKIRDSNGPLLASLASDAGLRCTFSRRVGDEAGATREAIAAAARAAELVVISGGVSVGDLDLVPEAIASLGGELLFHKVAMQPGKPVLVARLGRAWLAGLPGNPVSVLVGWRLLVRPLAEALAADPTAFAETPLAAALAAPVANRGNRLQLRPSALEHAGTPPRVTVLAWHGSHDLVAAAPANALTRVEPGATLPAGAAVLCYPLPWRRA